MYYNYHAKIKQRIENGELIGYHTKRDGFAFTLVFSTYPVERPIREHAAGLYEKILKNFSKTIDNG